MKKIKYIVIMLLGVIYLNSCEEVKNDVNDISNGKNLAMFEVSSASSTQIADGIEYPITVQLKVAGPSARDIKEDITVTLGVGETSTAVEGTHFRFGEKTVVLEAANNHLATFEFTMLTEGIETPLAEAPVLDLTVVEASGSANVIASGKPMMITFNYACPSFLAGTYNVSTLRDDGVVREWTETITEIGIGTYLTQYVGTWDPPLNPEGGFIFTDVCNVINVPLQDLAYGMYSNDVQGTAAGSVDENGVITISYSIDFTAGPATYVSTYTPQ